MKIYSEAMANANDILLKRRRKNPKEIPLSKMPTWVEEFPNVFKKGMTFQQIGDGSFSTAWLASNGKVYIATNEKNDMSKRILSDLNEKLGPQPNLPIIRYIGTTTMYGKDNPFSVYESELYRVGDADFWLEHPKQKQYLQCLLRMPEHTFFATFAEPSISNAYGMLESCFAHDLIDYEEQMDDWEDIVDSMKTLIDFANEYYPNISDFGKDVSIKNVALDAENKFILLDIFVAVPE